MKTITATKTDIKIISFRENKEAIVLFAHYLENGYETEEREMIEGENIFKGGENV